SINSLAGTSSDERKTTNVRRMAAKEKCSAFAGATEGGRDEDYKKSFARRRGGWNGLRPGMRGALNRWVAGAPRAIDVALCRRRLQRHFAAYPGRIFRSENGQEILR